MPPTSKQRDAMILYANLMEEVKLRMSCVEQTINGSTKFPAIIVREFCYLQFRLVCELIFISCLVAHGDVASDNKLLKETDANKIARQLDRLHPGFFPHAVEPKVIKDTPPRHVHFVPKSSGSFLTKKETITLYGRCGDHLHRGSVKKIMKTEPLSESSFQTVEGLANKITGLLSIHRIALFNQRQQIVCTMLAPQHGGNVQVLFIEASDT